MKILIVLTSHDRLGDTGRKTGFWLEELAAPYYVFLDAGAEITLASPAGGQPPLDPKSNEPEFPDRSHPPIRGGCGGQGAARRHGAARQRSPGRFRLGLLSRRPWAAVGPRRGCGFDRLIESFVAAGKPIALVCHAPGVLRHVEGPDGRPLVAGKTGDRLHQ